jgi:hypothetical protein
MSNPPRRKPFRLTKGDPVLSSAVIIALIPGCVEIAKRSGLPSRFAPLLAVIVGMSLVGLSHAAAGEQVRSITSAAEVILTGLISGLAAVGLYEVMPKTASVFRS